MTRGNVCCWEEKKKKRFCERVCKWGPIRYPRPQNVHIIITVYITNVLIDCRRDWTWSIKFPDETDRNDDEHSLDDTNVIAFLQINSSKSLKPTTNNFLCVFCKKSHEKFVNFWQLSLGVCSRFRVGNVSLLNWPASLCKQETERGSTAWLKDTSLPSSPLFLPITHEVLLCPKSCPSPS